MSGKVGAGPISPRISIRGYDRPEYCMGFIVEAADEYPRDDRAGRDDFHAQVFDRGVSVGYSSASSVGLSASSRASTE